MCVIMITEQTRPPEDMVEGAYRANGDGAGIAWREGGKVHWAKGLGLDEMQEMCASVPLPYIAHFRISTCGGPVRQLTHPFPVHQQTGLQLKGAFKGGVLFHNGHWGRWREVMQDVALKSKINIPLGKWSDSRAMAWCASIMGIGFLELIDEKIAVLGPGPEDLEVFGSWIYAEKEKIWVSNKSYEHRRGMWKSTKGEDHTTTRPTPGGTNDYFTRPPASQLMLNGNTDTQEGNQTPLPGANGGAPTVNPFVPVINAWREKEALFAAGNLSKSQWKKARKTYESDMNRLSRQAREQQQRERHVQFEAALDRIIDRPSQVH